MDYLTKENITFLGVLALFIWRAIDAIIKLGKRRQHELERLAFDMAKIKLQDPTTYDTAIITYFFYCLRYLKKKLGTPHQFAEWSQRKEIDLDNKIHALEANIRRLEDIEGRLNRNERIDIDEIIQKKLSWKEWAKDFIKLLAKVIKWKK